MNLGFKRKEDKDEIFWKQHGYEYFWCEYKAKKNIVIEWSSDTRECKALKLRKSGDVVWYIELDDLHSLMIFLELAGKKK